MHLEKLAHAYPFHLALTSKWPIVEIVTSIMSKAALLFLCITRLPVPCRVLESVGTLSFSQNRRQFSGSLHLAFEPFCSSRLPRNVTVSVSLLSISAPASSLASVFLMGWRNTTDILHCLIPPWALARFFSFYLQSVSARWKQGTLAQITSQSKRLLILSQSALDTLAVIEASGYQLLHHLCVRSFSVSTKAVDGLNMPNSAMNERASSKIADEVHETVFFCASTSQLSHDVLWQLPSRWKALQSV